jgi:hypothetical protein
MKGGCMNLYAVFFKEPDKEKATCQIGFWNNKEEAKKENYSDENDKVITAIEIKDDIENLFGSIMKFDGGNYLFVDALALVFVDIFQKGKDHGLEVASEKIGEIIKNK